MVLRNTGVGTQLQPVPVSLGTLLVERRPPGRLGTAKEVPTARSTVPAVPWVSVRAFSGAWPS
jgi:hypothetical protein